MKNTLRYVFDNPCTKSVIPIRKIVRIGPVQCHSWTGWDFRIWTDDGREEPFVDDHEKQCKKAFNDLADAITADWDRSISSACMGIISPEGFVLPHVVKVLECEDGNAVERPGFHVVTTGGREHRIRHETIKDAKAARANLINIMDSCWRSLS